MIGSRLCALCKKPIDDPEDMEQCMAEDEYKRTRFWMHRSCARKFLFLVDDLVADYKEAS